MVLWQAQVNAFKYTTKLLVYLQTASHEVN